jgi:hypothetical protein
MNESIIDWLTYRSYEHNRLRAPHIPDYKWRRLYNDAILFESIYEENLKRIQKEGAWGNVSLNH